MKAHFKPAESSDNPGEVMVAMMTRISNVPERSWRTDKDKTADCPRCGEPCYVDVENIHLAEKLYEGRLVPLCSLCAVQGHTNKGLIPMWLKRKNKTPDEVLRDVLRKAEEPNE